MPSASGRKRDLPCEIVRRLRYQQRQLRQATQVPFDAGAVQIVRIGALVRCGGREVPDEAVNLARAVDETHESADLLLLQSDRPVAKIGDDRSRLGLLARPQAGLRLGTDPGRQSGRISVDFQVPGRNGLQQGAAQDVALLGAFDGAFDAHAGGPGSFFQEFVEQPGLRPDSPEIQYASLDQRNVSYRLPYLFPLLQ